MTKFVSSVIHAKTETHVDSGDFGLPCTWVSKATRENHLFLCTLCLSVCVSASLTGLVSVDSGASYEFTTFKSDDSLIFVLIVHFQMRNSGKFITIRANTGQIHRLAFLKRMDASISLRFVTDEDK